jgi:hypothetical protein
MSPEVIWILAGGRERGFELSFGGFVGGSFCPMRGFVFSPIVCFQSLHGFDG